MTWEHWLRRLAHLCTPVFLIYYFLPSPVWEGGPQKPLGLLLLLAVVIIFETVRRLVNLSVPVLCLRPYERWRMAAYSWAAIGLATVFFTLPFEIAVPAVLGMAWVDPLIGELRSRESQLYPQVPIAAYFVIVLLSLTLVLGFDLRILLVAGITAPVAIWVEKQRWWRLDDDFTMMVIPAFLIALMFLILGTP